MTISSHSFVELKHTLIIDPDKVQQSAPDQQQPTTSTTTSCSPAQVLNWQDIKNYAVIMKFTNAQIIEYFVLRTVVDGLPVSDFKSMNLSALNLYKCGHIQKIEACISTANTLMYLRAICLPEMKKDTMYSLKMQLDDTNFEIQGAMSSWMWAKSKLQAHCCSVLCFG